ncbi:hypothetical protein RhiirA1_534455 [Rhizophagus irregularis]|uniref:RNA-binding protein 48 n=1 Tax=Rhizophagus irregularis TaxID=588596 RepID=A0A2N0RXM0_9GLOM|nr:hypothetical protein RhiirA1_534455 [Rhizophagus irregularis]
MSEDLNSLVVNPGRPAYRAGRKPIATRVYTINQESRYLVVENVPALGLTKELLELFALYGTIEKYQYLDDYPCEEFTDVYWIKFQSLPQARVAKKKVDDHIFFSSSLRVRYGPEYETIEDTRGKLRDRRTVISIKTNEQKEHENKIHHQTKLNDSSRSLTSIPVIYPQPDSSAYYNYYDYNYYNYPYSAQSQEPPIPGVGYPSSFSTSFTPTSYKYHTDPNSSMSSTVNTIRQRINDASKVSSDKDKGNVNQISTDSSIKSTHTTTPTKRRRI